MSREPFYFFLLDFLRKTVKVIEDANGILHIKCQSILHGLLPPYSVRLQDVSLFTLYDHISLYCTCILALR